MHLQGKKNTFLGRTGRAGGELSLGAVVLITIF